MKLVDAHCHLDGERFENDLDEVVERARKAGVENIIISGINPSTNREVLKISNKYDIVKCSFGIYPVDAVASKVKEANDGNIPRYVEAFDVDKELAWIEENKDQCIAIGEAGLDYKVLPETKELQKIEFKKVIELCKKLNKALVTHSRKAEEDLIEMLEEAKIKRVMMHCFQGKKRLIKRCVENGWFLSVPAVITRLEHFKMLVEIVPLENLITETDAPYLSPVYGERNEPANVRITIKEIAKIKNISEEVAAAQIYKNAKELFRL